MFPCFRTSMPLLLCGALMLPAGALAAPLLPEFVAANFIPGALITNTYLPFGPQTRSNLVSRGTDDAGAPFVERDELRFGGEGPEILGVRTTGIVDRAFEDGVLVEETFDYYAQDVLGNVWYMGEDVTNYNYDDEGNLIGTDSASSWRAGVNGALPGFAMPGDPVPGLAYYQEYAPADEALDEGLILTSLAALEVGGVRFEDVLRVFETSVLDPALREIKYYAPGVGLIRADEGLDGNLGNPRQVFELVAPVPVPAALPHLAAALGLMAALRRRRLPR